MNLFDAISPAQGGVPFRGQAPQDERQRAVWHLEMEKALLAANRVKVTPEPAGLALPAIASATNTTQRPDDDLTASAALPSLLALPAQGQLAGNGSRSDSAGDGAARLAKPSAAATAGPVFGQSAVVASAVVAPAVVEPSGAAVAAVPAALYSGAPEPDALPAGIAHTGSGDAVVAAAPGRLIPGGAELGQALVQSGQALQSNSGSALASGADPSPISGKAAFGGQHGPTGFESAGLEPAGSASVTAQTIPGAANRGPNDVTAPNPVAALGGTTPPSSLAARLSNSPPAPASVGAGQGHGLHQLALTAYQGGGAAASGVATGIAVASANSVGNAIPPASILPSLSLAQSRSAPLPVGEQSVPVLASIGSEDVLPFESVRPKQVLSEPWQRREFHLYQGADGVQAWIRDAELNPAQISAVAQGLRNELQQTGLKLKNLTINGKPLAAYEGLLWPLDGPAEALAPSDH